MADIKQAITSNQEHKRQENCKFSNHQLTNWKEEYSAWYEFVQSIAFDTPHLSPEERAALETFHFKFKD